MTHLTTKTVVKQRSVYNKLVFMVFFAVFQVPAKQVTRRILISPTQIGAHASFNNMYVLDPALSRMIPNDHT